MHIKPCPNFFNILYLTCYLSLLEYFETVIDFSWRFLPLSPKCRYFIDLSLDARDEMLEIFHWIFT